MPLADKACLHVDLSILVLVRAPLKMTLCWSVRGWQLQGLWHCGVPDPRRCTARHLPVVQLGEQFITTALPSLLIGLVSFREMTVSLHSESCMTGRAHTVLLFV